MSLKYERLYDKRIEEKEKFTGINNLHPSEVQLIHHAQSHANNTRYTRELNKIILPSADGDLI